MCKEFIKKLRLEWVFQTMAPPLLLTLNPKENIDEEKERKNGNKYKRQ